MNQKDLPPRWQNKLQKYLGERAGLEATDFTDLGYIRIDFEDSSSMEFTNYLILVDPTTEELAIFTEHCGYYIVPINALKNYDIIKLLININGGFNE